MVIPNNENGSLEETERFFLELGRLTSQPPLSEKFYERLRERLKHISSSTEESAQEDEILTTPTPHSEIEHLTRDLIARALDALELTYSRDDEDDIYSVFSGEGLPADMTCWYLIEGEDKDILRLLCTVALHVPQEKWEQALLLCNECHGQCRFGRAYLRIKDGETDAKLYFDACLDLTEGVKESSLQRFLMLRLYAAHDFFEKTHNEKLLVPVRAVLPIRG
jgi:hypothetical protein